jgi:type IV secretion system protein VirB5
MFGKRFVLLVLCLILALSGSAMAQGVPVTDAMNIAQSVANTARQITQMGLQLTALKDQYTQMITQYQSMTGSRGFGENYQNKQTYKDYLPNEWKSVYDKISSGGYSGLTSSGSSVRSSNQQYEICNGMVSYQKTACERQTALAYQHKANGTEAYDKAKARITQIEALMKKAGETKDQKEILELNARIQAEQTMINNEAIKLKMYKMIAESEKQLADQQEQAAAIKRMGATGGVKFEAVTFGN